MAQTPCCCRSARTAVHRASDCVSERARVGGGNAQWLPRTPGQSGPRGVAWRRLGGAALMWGTPQGMVYLATGHHDMRKSINGLALVVADTLGLDPVSPHWFVYPV
jgi:hypothetical protein